MDFLINLNVVRKSDDDSLDVLGVDAVKEIFALEVKDPSSSDSSCLDRARVGHSKQMAKEVNEKEVDAKNIYRSEFIQKIFIISYQNFKKT